MARVGRGSPMDSRWPLAVAALLSGRGLTDAAAAAGVAPRTLYRWRELPEWRRYYLEAAREALEAATGELRGAASEAVTTLRAALGDESPGIRVRAAIAVLDFALRAEAADLGDRVARLEAEAEGEGLPCDALN